MLVTKEFEFDSAHYLPNYYGKCERMHGHTYKLQVTVEGKVGENGLLIDFVILKKMVKEKVLDQLDHQVLNDFLEVPSAENVAIWIWNQLVDLKANIKEQLEDPNLPESVTKYFKDKDGKMDTSGFTEQIHLYEVSLWETSTAWVTYRGK
ncbi:MAG: 6-carboxytetrahydropterin synthase QueD [Deltaproteobacteria bacterium]|nr:6-carboxytetrahydropterin synthase QueD [Deltaproteobacteria bacterium]